MLSIMSFITWPNAKHEEPPPRRVKACLRFWLKLRVLFQTFICMISAMPFICHVKWNFLCKKLLVNKESGERGHLHTYHITYRFFQGAMTWQLSRHWKSRQIIHVKFSNPCRWNLELLYAVAVTLMKFRGVIIWCRSSDIDRTASLSLSLFL